MLRTKNYYSEKCIIALGSNGGTENITIISSITFKPWLIFYKLVYKMRFWVNEIVTNQN